MQRKTFIYLDAFLRDILWQTRATSSLGIWNTRMCEFHERIAKFIAISPFYSHELSEKRIRAMHNVTKCSTKRYIIIKQRHYHPSLACFYERNGTSVWRKSLISDHATKLRNQIIFTLRAVRPNGYCFAHYCSPCICEGSCMPMKWHNECSSCSFPTLCTPKIAYMCLRERLVHEILAEMHPTADYNLIYWPGVHTI